MDNVCDHVNMLFDGRNRPVAFAAARVYMLAQPSHKKVYNVDMCVRFKIYVYVDIPVGISLGGHQNGGWSLKPPCHGLFFSSCFQFGAKYRVDDPVAVIILAKFEYTRFSTTQNMLCCWCHQPSSNVNGVQRIVACRYACRISFGKRL